MKLSPKALRVNKKLKQEEVALFLGMSLTTYKRKENSINRWYACEIQKLSEFYEVDIRIFFEK